MFALGLIIGGFAYLIFFLGVLGLAYKQVLAGFTILFGVIPIFIFRKPLARIFSHIKFNLTKLQLFLLVILIAQSGINLIGALGPELAFDSLWYHLTIPKLYLQHHSIYFIPGWLLNYSAMPKLIEMLYMVGISFGSEIIPKLMHFTFGTFITIALYEFARKFLNKTYALLACVIFYANLVVGWMSITAYVDLGRTFFEFLALWSFIDFVEKRKTKNLYISSIFVGLAISTKLIALGSIGIYLVMLLLVFRKNMRQAIGYCLRFGIISILVSLPWFIFSYVHTGNPVYPIFSGLSLGYQPLTLLNPLNFINDSWTILTHAADPISPIYIILLPVILVLWRRFNNRERLIGLYCLLGFLAWYATPQTGGGRFILAYLPAFSVLTAIAVSKLKDNRFRTLYICIIIAIALSSIGYRALTNKRYVPYILGKQTKADFLAKNLNFEFGDFFDIDGFFASHIKPTDRVLIYGIHNLYYVDFPFIHESYLKKGDYFDYILTGYNTKLPQRYSNWIKIYQNITTHITLYNPPK